MIDISPPIPFLGKFWFLSYRAGCCWSIKLQDSLKCNISRKKWMMKFITGKQMNVEIFYNFVLLFWACLARHVQSTQIVFLSLQISRKMWRMKLIFCLHINTKVFCKLVVCLWVSVARHTQSTQSNKFAISLQYLKENALEKFTLFSLKLVWYSLLKILRLKLSIWQKNYYYDVRYALLNPIK